MYFIIMNQGDKIFYKDNYGKILLESEIIIIF